MSHNQLAIDAAIEVFRAGDPEAFAATAATLEPADLADVLASLADDERLQAVRALPPEISAEALAEMPEDAHAEDTLAALDPEVAADIVEELDDDDAADILGELEPEAQERILAATEDEDRAELEHLLRYHEESAGGIMTTHLVRVHDTDTAEDAITSIRQQVEEVENFYKVFVVDRFERLVGILPLEALVLSSPQTEVRAIMDTADITVQADMDQEHVARIMTRYNLPSVPVVSADGKLLGRVTFDDVTDVIVEEHTEDLLRFSGVSADEGLAVALRTAVRNRLPWLYVNLLTGFLSAAVVYFFRARIEEAVTLAVFMPLIAGLGGNAGTQSLAVTVRRLALGLVSRKEFFSSIGKEAAIGAANGLAVGVVLSLITVALGEGYQLGVRVFMALSFNLLVAGTAGAFLPMLLDRLGADPAIASSVFVTTLTDIVGFAFLLGLAGWLIG